MSQIGIKTKIAIVTGGNRGIGLAISKVLKELGYLVAIIHKHDNTKLAGGGVVPKGNNEFDLDFIGDVGNREHVKTFFSEVQKLAEKNDAEIRVLVNNAGIASAVKFFDLKEKDFEDMFATNVIGAFIMSQEFALMAEKGSSDDIKSHIINISSVSGLTGFSGHAHYCASKFALDGMSKVMAKELSKVGIAVNNVCPGPTQTDMWTQLDREYKAAGFMPEEANEDDYSKKLLIKRMGKPEDIAEAVAFLVGQEYVTGINLPVCGGNIMR